MNEQDRDTLARLERKVDRQIEKLSQYHALVIGEARLGHVFRCEVRRLRKLIDGNGDNGLRSRIDRLERSRKRVWKTLSAAVAAIVGIMGVLAPPFVQWLAQKLGAK